MPSSVSHRILAGFAIDVPWIRVVLAMDVCRIRVDFALYYHGISFGFAQSEADLTLIDSSPMRIRQNRPGAFFVKVP